MINMVQYGMQLVLIMHEVLKKESAMCARYGKLTKNFYIKEVAYEC